MRLLYLVSAASIGVWTLSAQTPDDCRALKHRGKLAETQACFSKLVNSNNPFYRAEGLWATEQYQPAADLFLTLVKQDPKNAQVRVRRGRLFLERFDPAEAKKMFDEALEI